MMSLMYLTQMLDEHHGIAPIVIIAFMRNLFSGCLKDNKHLSYGFLTGILRAAKARIFSGLNNLCVNSIPDEPYSEYFGFNADEVRDLARYYGAEDKFDEVCDWYDGCRFGDTEIFNPWSVINYFRNHCQPIAVSPPAATTSSVKSSPKLTRTSTPD